MDVQVFLEGVQGLGVDSYYGVPDSRLRPICDTLYQKYGIGKNHIVAANEGGAVGLAAGHYLATGRPALVYMQNSGIGNAVNPIASLLNETVYGIPCVFVIGWRGEPGIKDEPQHLFQGAVTLSMLETLGILTFVLDKDTAETRISTSWLKESLRIHRQKGISVAFVVKKGGLKSPRQRPNIKTNAALSRETAIRMITQSAGETDIFVSTTGKASRELFEIREAQGQAPRA